MESQEHFLLLELPFDIRIEIVSYLLPDQHFILNEAYRTDIDRINRVRPLGLDAPTWSNFDYKSRSPYPDILLTNHQLYAEGFYYLYTLKSLKLKVHFKKLRIQFPDPLGPVSCCDQAWDSAEPKAWDFQPQVVVEDADYEGSYQENAAGDSGAPSTFAWLLSVFATCPKLADECIIELPESLKDNPTCRHAPNDMPKDLTGGPRSKRKRNVV
ncbi:MAG: hypothetical protein Q9221_008949 [Calogaya cf. arnoldii]